jgi:hypothetical protein
MPNYKIKNLTLYDQMSRKLLTGNDIVMPHREISEVHQGGTHV